jgi:hypothetical protein
VLEESVPNGYRPRTYLPDFALRAPHKIVFEGTGEFWVLVVPGLKISAAKFISGGAELRDLSDILQSTMFPETFPDDKEIKLLRRGKLTCLKNADTCRLLVSSAETVRYVN